ncbi:MAG TPA: uroporphyrinogen decarboxylase family protein [Candidatus Hydrogenedentes bacterium]|nr:uroporphyrinogen decarboxylase family protein [Candidatus Hydrogenedentota bacterium]HQM48189.1 uroporphyrinogen decarboxylase family protein [Candidatus Hydrogenedentota bacterium]
MSRVETEDFRLLPVSEMEARLAQFEKRVNAAQCAYPPTKERVRQALRGTGDGRCPVRLKRHSLDLILKYGDELASLFCEYPDDVVALIPYDITIGYQSPGKTPRVNVVEALMTDMQWLDEWGTRWGHAFGGVGATPLDCPIKDWAMLDDYFENGMPDPNAPGRLDSVTAPLALHKETKYCFGIIHLALFERLHCLRGMENVFTDFLIHEAEVERLLDGLEEYLLEIVRQWGALGADAVFFTDDWGSQSGLMISPDQWRRLFKDRYARTFAEVHRLGMDAIFHSCGNVTGIVGELVDIGLDVLDPVQPGAMDIEELARDFGGQLAFSGAVDVQELLVHGSAEQVKDEVRRIIDILGRPFGGALLLGPANVMTPDIPFANLEALFEAAHGVV